MDRYRKEVKIGEGGYGVVHKATNIETGDLVALKKVGIKNFQEGVAVATLREIKLLQELDHPHIISLFDVCVMTKFYSIYSFSYQFK